MADPWLVISETRDEALAEALAWAQLVTTLDHVLVVASPGTAASVRAQLAWYPSVELALQPRDLGTAVELLHPVARVLERDPLGRVVFVPPNFRLGAPRALADALHTASYAIAPHQVVLLGALPLDPRPGGDPFIAAALVTTFWDQARANLPVHARMFERYIAAIATPAEDIALEGVFAQLQPANVSCDLLAHSRTRAVVPLDPNALQVRVLSFDQAASPPPALDRGRDVAQERRPDLVHRLSGALLPGARGRNSGAFAVARSTSSGREQR